MGIKRGDFRLSSDQSGQKKRRGAGQVKKGGKPLNESTNRGLGNTD